MKSLATAFTLLLVATPAFADSVTYKGTIGKLPIVLELSKEPGRGVTDIFGRYFYADKGIDIPLHMEAGRGGLNLVEELPCKEDTKNCPNAQDDTPSNPPLGAKWALEVTKRGAALEGKWTDNGRSQTVTLEKVGTRPFEPSDPASPGNLTDFAAALIYSDDVLTPETSPYDYLKVSGALKETDPETLSGSTFRYVSDPRTIFQFPRIVKAGDTDLTAANDYLQQRHWTFSLDALWCEAQIYQGFGWNGYNYDAGTLGWWDEETVAVSYLSPTLLSWTEAGSLSCGGAHPYNHYEFHNLDVKTGTPIDLSMIFKGWVAKDFDGKLADIVDARTHPRDFQWGPDEELAKFVKAHRQTDAELGLEPDSECGIDELIDSNLAVGFKDGDKVLFTLGDLPNVIQACSSDLYEAPIAELKDLLASGAADYFPSLKS
ncbi:MAG: hypothetical protein ABIQ30_01250 [Devosia sp.]